LNVRGTLRVTARVSEPRFKNSRSGIIIPGESPPARFGVGGSYFPRGSSGAGYGPN